MQGNLKSSKAVLLSAAVAGLLSTAQAVAHDHDKAGHSEPAPGTVKCYGVNACKGKGECGSQKNKTSCAGSNACKGKGWVRMKAEECKAKGGRTTES